MNERVEKKEEQKEEEEKEKKRENDTFLVLDFSLDVLDGVGGLDLEGDGLTSQSLHKNLHFCVLLLQAILISKYNVSFSDSRRTER